MGVGARMGHSEGVEALRSRFRGALLRPRDDGYEDARRIWNGAIDKRPSLIARCTSRDDVVEAVRWARERGLEIAVRGGGHGVAGHALSDGGVVVDCSPMRGIEVDPERRIARVGPGVLLGDLMAATQAHGLAVPIGIVSHTGVAGLTLGGGIGWLMRKFGLTCDNLLAAEVVTADGEVVRASEEDEPDLLWGLRGGGGNFGVVTSFEFACHPVGPIVLAGPIMWAAEDAEDVLTFYRDFARSAPDDLTTISLIRRAPPAPWVPEELHWRPAVIVANCYAGDVETGARVLEPLRRWGSPLVDAVAPTDLTGYHSFVDASVPPGFGYYWKSHYLRDLTGEAIGAFVKRGWETESRRSYTIVFHMGGAVRRVPAETTAFEDRTAEFAPNVNATWDDLSNPLDVDWARTLFDALRPASTGKGYVNFMSADEQPRVARAFGETKLARLADLKRRYDPDNVFRLNHNVAPARVQGRPRGRGRAPLPAGRSAPR